MTRRFILTTATLAAFLATGAPISGAIPTARRPEQAIGRIEPLTQAPTLINIGESLLAVHAFGPAIPGDSLEVALFLPPGIISPQDIQLWAGNKNGWGSLASRSEPVIGASGLHHASVIIPDPLPNQARLWISLGRDHGRPDTGSVPLPLG